jgi:hypothetical protein
MNETRKGFLRQIREALTSSKNGFQSVTEKDLRRGLVIVLVTAIISSYAGMVYLSKIPVEVLISSLASYNVDPGPVVQAMGTFAAIGGFIRVLIDWALLTLMMHAFATLLSGKGSLRRFFALTGFAYLPLTLQQVLRVVDALIAQPSALVNIYVSNAQATGLMKVIVSMNLFTLFGLAALVLKGFAVSENYESTTRKGLLIAAVPYILFIILDLII